MNGNFWHMIRIRFDQTNGLVITLLIFVITIVTSNYNSLYIGLIIFVGLTLLLLIWTFYRTAEDLFFENINLKRYKNSLPSIIQVRKKEGALALCLLNPSELFSVNALVTFYYYHKSYEEVIGDGVVVNVQQDDKIIAVEMRHISRGHKRTLEKLIQNNVECLQRIRIKPIILKDYWDQLIGERI